MDMKFIQLRSRLARKVEENIWQKQIIETLRREIAELEAERRRQDSGLIRFIRRVEFWLDR